MKHIRKYFFVYLVFLFPVILGSFFQLIFSYIAVDFCEVAALFQAKFSFSGRKVFGGCLQQSWYLIVVVFFPAFIGVLYVVMLRKYKGNKSKQAEIPSKFFRYSLLFWLAYFGFMYFQPLPVSIRAEQKQMGVLVNPLAFYFFIIFPHLLFGCWLAFLLFILKTRRSK